MHSNLEVCGLSFTDTSGTWYVDFSFKDNEESTQRLVTHLNSKFNNQTNDIDTLYYQLLSMQVLKEHSVEHMSKKKIGTSQIRRVNHQVLSQS